jgi:hypothetical protein
LDYDVTLDLASTEWLDFALAKLSTEAGVTRIDTLGVALQGANIGLSGLLRDGRWDAHADLSLPDARLLRRVHPTAGDSLALKIAAEADFQGTLESPRLNVSVRGNAAGPNYRLPKLIGHARWDGLGLAAKISAPDGLVAGPANLSELTATYETGIVPTSAGALDNAGGTEAGDANAVSPSAGTSDDDAGFPAITLLPGRISLALRGPNIELFHVADVDNPDGWHIRADSLALKLVDRELKNTKPFDLWVKPKEQMLVVSDFLLQGSLGRIEADGYSCPDSCTLSAQASVNLPHLLQGSISETGET